MAKKLQVEIVGDASSLQRALRSSSQEAQGFGHTLGGVAKTAALVAGGAALGGLAITLKTGIAEWSNSTRVTAQTEAGLKSTAGAANVTKKQIQDLAGAILQKSGIDDEAVQSGENMLLTFTNIRNEAGKGNDIFNQTTRTLADMATKMNGGVAPSAEQMSKQAILLGKALNDPTKGMTALTRVGVTFTQAQKDQVAAMMKAGDTMGAQKLILGELNKEFGGSAEAMGKTLPGQIDILKESFNNLAGDIVGGLVPTFQTIVSWTAEHWPQISAVFKSVFGAIGDAIQFVRPYLALLIQQSEQVVARVKADWPQIRETIQNVMNTVRDIIAGVVNIVQAIWSRFGDTIMSVVNRSLGAAVSVIRNTMNVIAGIFQLIADVLHGRWGEAWDDVKKIVSNAVQAVFTILKTMAANALEAAKAIGRAIIDGILAGVEGLGQALKDKVTGMLHSAIDGIKGAFGIHSPSTVTRDEIGGPLGEGVIEGWLLGTAQLPSKVSQKLQDAVTAGQQVIQSAQAKFQTAWSALTSDANSALSGITGALQTPAEKTLAALQAKHDADQRQQALSDARAALASAQAGTDPEAIKAAEQQLSDALYAIQVAGLEKQAAQQRLQLNARIQLQQKHFAAALAALQEHLAKGHTAYKQAQTEILKLFKSYGINYANAGADLGVAFVQGLKESIAAAAAKSGALKDRLATVAAGINVPHLDTGGRILETGIAVVHKGETVVPAGKGGDVVNVNVYGWVGSDQQIADRVRRELLRVKAQNGELGLA